MTARCSAWCGDSQRGAMRSRTPPAPSHSARGSLLGVAIIETKLPSARLGWLVVIWSGAWLALFVVTGLYGPAPAYITALVVGVALLRTAT